MAESGPVGSGQARYDDGVEKHSTPFLLSASEICLRRGVWSLQWEANRITPTSLIRRGILYGLTSDREDFPEACGEEVMDLASTRGVETTSHTPYDQAVHSATLADVICAAIRKARTAPWAKPEDKPLDGILWRSGALLNEKGNLCRVILVDYWNERRAASEMMSWYTMGEICAYEIPMDQVIVCLGQFRDGKRTGPFSRGYVHPKNGKLRFKKKSQGSTTDFKNTWRRVYREDTEFDRYEWLQAMYEDDSLQENLFVVHVPVPGSSKIGHIRELAKRKLERLRKIESLPPIQLTGCWHPNLCSFVHVCHGRFETPNENSGFIPTLSLTTTVK